MSRYRVAVQTTECYFVEALSLESAARRGLALAALGATPAYRLPREADTEEIADTGEPPVDETLSGYDKLARRLHKRLHGWLL